MATVVNKETLQALFKVNADNYPTEEWVINPDRSLLETVPKKYIKVVGDSLVEMSQSEKDAVDSAEIIAERNDIKILPGLLERYCHSSDIEIQKNSDVVTFVFGADRHTDPNTFEYSNGEVILLKKGFYSIRYEISMDKINGGKKTTSKTWIEINEGSLWVEIAGTRCWGYHRQEDNGTSTIHSQITTFFQKGDKIRIRGSIENGDKLQTVPHGCRLNLEYKG